MAIELWLHKLGAQQIEGDVSRWRWVLEECSADITMEQDQLRVVWEKKGNFSEYCFPYGLSRADVEAAISHGP